jgi:hypothetical protein
MARRNEVPVLREAHWDRVGVETAATEGKTLLEAATEEDWVADWSHVRRKVSVGYRNPSVRT